MKRFYLVYIEGLKSVSVKLRTNHDMIYPSLKIDDKEDMKVLKSLYKMELSEFVSLVREKLGERPYRQHMQISSLREKAHEEEWYEGAWKFTTDKVEKMLKLSSTPEMEEEEFFSEWVAQVEAEKKAKALERKRLEEERKALESKKEKKLVKKSVEKKDDDLTAEELAGMVDALFGTIKADTKHRLVKKTKKTLNRKR